MILSLNKNDALAAANEVWTLGQTPLAHLLSAAGSGFFWVWKKHNPMEVVRVCAGVDACQTRGQCLPSLALAGGLFRLIVNHPPTRTPLSGRRR